MNRLFSLRRDYICDEYNIKTIVLRKTSRRDSKTKSFFPVLDKKKTGILLVLWHNDQGKSYIQIKKHYRNSRKKKKNRRDNLNILNAYLFKSNIYIRCNLQYTYGDRILVLLTLIVCSENRILHRKSVRGETRAD